MSGSKILYNLAHQAVKWVTIWVKKVLKGLVGPILPSFGGSIHFKSTRGEKNEFRENARFDFRQALTRFKGFNSCDHMIQGRPRI